MVKAVFILVHGGNEYAKVKRTKGDKDRAYLEWSLRRSLVLMICRKRHLFNIVDTRETEAADELRFVIEFEGRVELERRGKAYREIKAMLESDSGWLKWK